MAAVALPEVLLDRHVDRLPGRQVRTWTKIFLSDVRARGLARLTLWEGWAIEHDANDTLTIDELRAAISSFSQADHLRLRKAARILCGGSGYEWNELVNEAVVRALAGTRLCPRVTRPVVFLANAMKSIVSAGRDSLALQPKTTSLAATGTDGQAIDPPSPQRTAEEVRVARDECAARLDALDTLFENDEEAQMVILADIDGLDAEAIREMHGWSLTQLATVRRRIRRRIEARYPQGFPA